MVSVNVALFSRREPSTWAGYYTCRVWVVPFRMPNMWRRHGVEMWRRVDG